MNGRIGIVELLIANGADVTKDSDLATPLDALLKVTIRLEESETADLLRKKGAKSWAEDFFHVAACWSLRAILVVIYRVHQDPLRRVFFRCQKDVKFDIFDTVKCLFIKVFKPDDTFQASCEGSIPFTRSTSFILYL